MLHATCHCGNIRLEAAQLPATLTSCNCSICHRLGALWGYFDAAEVGIKTGAQPLSAYSWGDRSITYHCCSRCGCTTHYTMTEPDGRERVAINCRMAPATEIGAIPIRRFDGLISWQYLDEQPDDDSR
ncbi:MAG: aldehyde-activating protein [Gammaproteobacteria bacterium]|nr:aldehyde-activating protein [Gammaproteobacteria bacterium]